MKMKKSLHGPLAVLAAIALWILTLAFTVFGIAFLNTQYWTAGIVAVIFAMVIAPVPWWQRAVIKKTFPGKLRAIVAVVLAIMSFVLIPSGDGRDAETPPPDDLLIVKQTDLSENAPGSDGKDPDSDGKDPDEDITEDVDEDITEDPEENTEGAEESEESDTSEPVTEDAAAEDPTGENPEVSPDETADTPAEEITVVPVVIPAAEFPGSSPGESPGTSPKESNGAAPEISPKESPKAAPKTSPAVEAGDAPAEDTEGNPPEDAAGNSPEDTAPGSTREPKAYVSEPPEGCDYVLNINTGKFHFPECSSVEEMKDKNRRYFTGTREEAMEAGYSPCGRCKP